MTLVDQFESVFNAAAKDVFRFEHVPFTSVLVIADQGESYTRAFAGTIRRFLKVLDDHRHVDWRHVQGAAFRTVGELLDLVNRENPDLICTYRSLHSRAWRWPYTLGEFLDVLTQETRFPILIMPHPELPDEGRKHRDTHSVMAVTDHITGDHRLISIAAELTSPDGTLLLAHVEDKAAFEYYMRMISKISAIDTDDARAAIRRQLFKEPADFIASCKEAMRKENVPVRLAGIVTMGHHLTEYRRLIEEHDVDLLVMNTKDDDQLAMNGLAYSLAVELRTLPILAV